MPKINDTKQKVDRILKEGTETVFDKLIRVLTVECGGEAVVAHNLAKMIQHDAPQMDPQAKAELAQLSALTDENTQLNAKQAELTSTLAAVNANLDASNRELNQEKAQVTALTESQKNFDAKVAVELAKHGIRPQAVAAEEQAKPGKAGLSLTEQCIAARGAAGTETK